MRSIFTTSLTALLCLAAVAPPAFAADKPLSQEDTEWLDRVTFGLDTATVASYRDLGRRRFLEAQLHPKTDALPQPIAAQIAAIDVPGRDRSRVEGISQTDRNTLGPEVGGQRDRCWK